MHGTLLFPDMQLSYKTILVIALVRIASVFVVQTYFDPDEFWQAPEVAHRIVFGYGYQTWEWETDKAIRSYVHPFMFVPVYKLLQMTGMDTGYMTV